MGLDARLFARDTLGLAQGCDVDRDWEFYRLVQEITNFDGSNGIGEIEITTKQMQEISYDIAECLIATIREQKVIPYTDSNNCKHERDVFKRISYLNKLLDKVKKVMDFPHDEWQYFYYFSW